MDSMSFAKNFTNTAYAYEQIVERRFGISPTTTDEAENSFFRFFSELKNAISRFLFSGTTNDIVRAYRGLKQAVHDDLAKLGDLKADYHREFNVTLDGVDRKFTVSQSFENNMFKLQCGFADQEDGMDVIDGDLETFLTELTDSLQADRFDDFISVYSDQVGGLKMLTAHTGEMNGPFHSKGYLEEHGPIPAVELLNTIGAKEFFEQVNSVTLYHSEELSKQDAEKIAFTKKIVHLSDSYYRNELKAEKSANQALLGCSGDDLPNQTEPVCMLQTTTLMNAEQAKIRAHIFSIPALPKVNPYSTCGDHIIAAANKCEAKRIILRPADNSNVFRQGVLKDEDKLVAEKLAVTIKALREAGKQVDVDDYYGISGKRQDTQLYDWESGVHALFWEEVNKHLGDEPLELKKSPLVKEGDMIVNTKWQPDTLVGNGLGLEDIGCAFDLSSTELIVRTTANPAHAMRCFLYHQQQKQQTNFI